MRHLQRETAQRGDGRAELIRVSEDQYRITTPNHTFEKDGVQFHAEYKDLFFKFASNTLFWSSSEDLFSLDVTEIVRQIPAARTHHAYWKIWPQRADSVTRSKFLNSYIVPWTVQMQQRDGEPTEKHAARRSLLKLGQLVIDGLVNDVDEYIVKTRFANSDQGYRRTYSFRFRRGCRLHAFVRGLVATDSVLEHSKPSNSFAFAYVNVEVPDELKDVLFGYSSYLFSDQPMVVRALSQYLENGRLSASIAAAIDTKNIPFVGVQLPVGIDTESSGKLSLVHSAQLWMQELGFPVGDASARLRDGKFELAIGGDPGGVDEVELSPQRLTVFEASADFVSIASAPVDSPVRGMLADIDRKLFRSGSRLDRLERSRHLVYGWKWKNHLQDARVENEGGWSASLKVRADKSGQVSIDVNIGAELYYFVKSLPSASFR